MDIETLLRRMDNKGNPHECCTELNLEGRVELLFHLKGVPYRYVVVGNQAVELVAKPPTQIMRPIGVDTFGAMGARA